jgi:hypothetical protein
MGLTPPPELRHVFFPSVFFFPVSLIFQFTDLRATWSAVDDSAFSPSATGKKRNLSSMLFRV